MLKTFPVLLLLLSSCAAATATARDDAYRSAAEVFCASLIRPEAFKECVPAVIKHTREIAEGQQVGAQ